jgi:hypothetical protein
VPLEFEPSLKWRYHPKTQNLVGFRFAVIYLNMKETHLQIKVARARTSAH